MESLFIWDENSHSAECQTLGIRLAQLDYQIPEHVRKVLAEVALDKGHYHQYTAGIGHPRLMQNVSKLYSPLIGRHIDAPNEILVTSGANEALYTAILGHVEKGDEVVVIEPFYKCYVPLILAAGGIPRFVTLRRKTSSPNNNTTSADWILDTHELDSVFNSHTKMIILNNPHNPLGKVFLTEELEKIADLCKKHNVLCLSDEVFEWMVYEPAKHVRICMWERSITVCSAGKTFLATGWKVGWAYGRAELIVNMKVAYQNSSYTPLQEAVARLLDFEMARYTSPDCYFTSLPRELLLKRDSLVNILKKNGFNPTVPEAGYFVVVNWNQQIKYI